MTRCLLLVLLLRDCGVECASFHLYLFLLRDCGVECASFHLYLFLLRGCGVECASFHLYLFLLRDCGMECESFPAEECEAFPLLSLLLSLLLLLLPLPQLRLPALPLLSPSSIPAISPAKVLLADEVAVATSASARGVVTPDKEILAQPWCTEAGLLAPPCAATFPPALRDFSCRLTIPHQLAHPERIVLVLSHPLAAPNRDFPWCRQCPYREEPRRKESIAALPRAPLPL